MSIKHPKISMEQIDVFFFKVSYVCQRVQVNILKKKEKKANAIISMNRMQTLHLNWVLTPTKNRYDKLSSLVFRVYLLLLQVR